MVDDYTLPMQARPPSHDEIQEMVRSSGLEFSRAQQIINDGCIVRYTGQGVGVLMLWRLPGVFFDEHGREVGPAVAKMAGYDTKALLQQKRKREAMAKATEAIEAQFNVPSTREIIAEKGGYRVVGLGMNRYNIEYGDTHEPINTKGFITDKDVALKTLDAVAGTEEVDAEV